MKIYVRIPAERVEEPAMAYIGEDGALATALDGLEIRGRYATDDAPDAYTEWTCEAYIGGRWVPCIFPARVYFESVGYYGKLVEVTA